MTDSSFIRPMESASTSGVIRLVVESSSGERRVFAAEASFEDGQMYWEVTMGWIGWTRLHPGWKPIGWMPLDTLGDV